MTPTKEQHEKARKLCLSIVRMPVEGIADTYCFHCEEIAQFAADEAEAARAEALEVAAQICQRNCAYRCTQRIRALAPRPNPACPSG